jgi:hypothetical protein
MLSTEETGYFLFGLYQSNSIQSTPSWGEQVNLFSTQVPDFTYVTKIGNPLFSAFSGQNKFTVLGGVGSADSVDDDIVDEPWTHDQSSF